MRPIALLIRPVDTGVVSSQARRLGRYISHSLAKAQPSQPVALGYGHSNTVYWKENGPRDEGVDAEDFHHHLEEPYLYTEHELMVTSYDSRSAYAHVGVESIFMDNGFTWCDQGLREPFPWSGGQLFGSTFGGWEI